MGRKKKVDKELTFPFGKYKGKSLIVVMQEEPSYLCWFVQSIEGCQDIMEAFVALPGFQEEWAKYYQRKYRREMTTRQIVEDMVRDMFAGEDHAEPTPEQFDDLCDRLFNAPPGAS